MIGRICERAYSISFVLATLTVATIGPALADPIADFYKGKRGTMIIGYNPGGGYDLYGRLVANNIGRYLPGKPTFISKNMPGVGSMKAANFMYNQAARDGGTIGVIGQAMALEQRLGNKRIKYDASKFNWIGRLTANVEVTIVWHTSPVNSIQDVMKRPVVLAATSSRGLSAQLPSMLNYIAGTKFQIITGYRGSTGGMLAMERGEVEASHTGWATLKARKQAWLRDKQIRILVQYAAKRHPDLQHIPTSAELARTPKDRAVAELFALSGQVGRAVMAPPDIPKTRVRALRAAFKAMANDPTFQAMLRKRKVEFNPMFGEDLQKVVAGMLAVPDDVASHARKARKLKKKRKRKKKP